MPVGPGSEGVALASGVWRLASGVWRLGLTRHLHHTGRALTSLYDP
jgi:hypothetical protein